MVEAETEVQMVLLVVRDTISISLIVDMMFFLLLQAEVMVVLQMINMELVQTVLHPSSLKEDIAIINM